MPQSPGAACGVPSGAGGEPPLWAHCLGVASLRLAENVIFWDWGDIYVIQAGTRVRVHLSVCNVWELRQRQEEGSGMAWLRWQHFCYTGCCCLVRKKNRIEKWILVKSGHSLLHERGILLRANAATSSSHYLQGEKTCHFWGVFFFLEASEFPYFRQMNYF